MAFKSLISDGFESVKVMTIRPFGEDRQVSGIFKKRINVAKYQPNRRNLTTLEI